VLGCGLDSCWSVCCEVPCSAWLWVRVLWSIWWCSAWLWVRFLGLAGQSAGVVLGGGFDSWVLPNSTSRHVLSPSSVWPAVRQAVCQVARLLTIEARNFKLGLRMSYDNITSHTKHHCDLTYFRNNEHVRLASHQEDQPASPAHTDAEIVEDQPASLSHSNAETIVDQPASTSHSDTEKNPTK
jgi:hypothetical protein